MTANGASVKVVASTCLQWAQSIDALLSDTEGLKLFRSFLSEDFVTHPLDFYLACVGLRKSGAVSNDQERLRAFLKSLYRKYLRSNSDCFVPLSDQLRKAFQAQLSSDSENFKTSWSAVVENIQEDVKILIQRTLYQQFLKSDHYVNHLQKYFPNQTVEDDQNAENLGQSGQTTALPTLHEDSVLKPEDCLFIHATPTSSLLNSIAEVDKTGKAQSSQSNSSKSHVNPYSVSYFANVSAIDSERQSVLSDQQNEMEFQASLTDCSMGSYRQRWHERRHNKQTVGNHSRRRMAQLVVNASQNGSLSDANHGPSSASLAARMNSSFGGLPPTSSIYPISHVHNTSAHHHSMVSSASLRLMSGASHLLNNPDFLLKHQPFIPRGDRPTKLSNLAQEHPEEFAKLLCSKLEKVVAEREKDERIERCLRECAANIVDASDDGMTLSGCQSQMSQSLGARRSSTKISSSLAKFVQSLSSEQDEDTADEHAQSILEDHMSRVWDKTVSIEPGSRVITMTTSHGANHSLDHSPAIFPDSNTAFSRSFHGPATTPAAAPAARFGRSNQNLTPTTRSKLQKITNPDILSLSSCDSGALVHAQKLKIYSHQNHHRQMLMDPHGHFDSGISIADTESAKSLPPLSSAAKQKVLNWMLHNDKTSVSVAKSDQNSMPPPAPLPPTSVSQFHTHAVSGTQSDSEMKGPSRNPRLTTNVSKGRSKRLPESKQFDETVSTPTNYGGGPTHDYTTVAYKFSDEEIPYRSQLPGKNVTLRQFKQLISKRGLYRFYFKHATDEFAGGCVNEEVVEDDDVLPLFDGKVFARVERVEQATGSAMS